MISLAAGQAISAAGAIIGLQVLAAHLSVTSFGEIALMLTIASFAQQALYAPIGSGAARLWPVASEHSNSNSLLKAFFFLLGASTALDIVAAATSRVAQPDNRSAGSFGALLAAASSVSSAFDSLQNAARKRLTAALHQAASYWFRYGAAYVGLILFSRDSVTIGVAMTIGLLPVLLSQATSLRRNLWSFSVAAAEPLHAATEASGPRAANTTREYCRMLIHYGWPFALWGTFGGLRCMRTMVPTVLCLYC